MGILRRSLGLIVAMALVVASLPLAHAMPAAPDHASHAVSAMPADHAHHCDEAGMNSAPSHDRDNNDRPAPCKCLNCSMCVANFVAPLLRIATPERRVLAVIYRIDAVRLAGIDARIDPGIPILAF